MVVSFGPLDHALQAGCLEQAPQQRKPPVRRRQLADGHELVVRKPLLIEEYDVLVERLLGVTGGHQRLGQDEPKQDVVRVGLDRLTQRDNPVVGHVPHLRLSQRRTRGGTTQEYTQKPSQIIANANDSGPRPAIRRP